jgi:predicted nucleotidyltransferase component of viral defense system
MPHQHHHRAIPGRAINMKARENDGRVQSIRQRLDNAFRARGENVEFALQRYAIERFLYRLGQSRHRERFVLKGATLFGMWGTAYRPTRDIDFTGYGSPDPQSVIEAFREICSTPDEIASLAFDTDSISAEPIRDGSEYAGLRLKVKAWLGKSPISIQVDVGFGNAIVPGPEEREYRTLLGDPPPRILTYPPESVVAEKMHATVILGERNSRYKDFYDIHALAQAFSFERTTLLGAVRATFDRRATRITAETPVALTGPFYSDESRSQQWRAYVTRNDLHGVSRDFDTVGDVVIGFLRPLWEDLGANRVTAGEWSAGGPWRSTEVTPL